MSGAEIVESHQDFSICQGNDGYIIKDDEGHRVDYEEAPRPVRSAYDRLELRRQGQLELDFT